MAKFKVIKVATFGYKGKTYAAGDTVEISEADAKRLIPCDYLEPVPVAPEKQSKQEKAKK